MISLTIAIPLAGGCVALLAGRRAAPVALVTAAATVGATIAVALSIWRTGPLTHEMGGWAAPLGIQLTADGLSVALVLVTAAILCAVLPYATAYQRRVGADRAADRPFWVLALVLWGGLNALFLSADVFNLYVCLELTTLAAVALVVTEGDEDAFHGALRYLLAAFIASSFYLLGVAILYASYGRLDLAGLALVATSDIPTGTATALITGGLALKAALFPLHFWLPRAHSAAPAPASALLSSLVVTAAFYIFLRLSTGVFAPVLTTSAGHFLGTLGALAIIWGSLQAMRQQHLKVLIAYSTVAQIGYFFVAIPIIIAAAAAGPDGVRWGTMAWSGVAYHAVSHALAKAALFLAAGNIVIALRGDRIVGISGLASHLPMTTYAFGIAGMTLIGLPPSGGFIAKWLLVSSAIESGEWWWAVVMLLGGLMTAGYVFLVLGQELSRADSDRGVDLRPVPRTMEAAAFALALASLLLGLRVPEPLEFLRTGLPLGGP